MTHTAARGWLGPWPPTGAAPSLHSDSVHAFAIPLEQPAQVVDRLSCLLSDRELSAASRYVFPRDRRRHVVSQACMRQILGAFLGQRPEQVQFSYGRRGKPGLAAVPWLTFNLSHADAWALVGIARERAIGVDLEAVRPLPDYELIAEYAFSPRERAALAAEPEAVRLESFFRCWTRKEAYVKAVGDGLYGALDRFTVSLGAGMPAALLAVDDQPGEALRWQLAAVQPAPGHVGALVVEGWEWNVECWTWEAAV